MRHGVMLIDGGVLDPMPIAPSFSDQTDLTIAVGLGGAREKIHIQPDKEKIQQEKGDKQDSHIHQKIMNFINSFINEEPQVKEPDLDALDVANQALDAMQSTISRQKLACYPPDYVIEIARNACGILEFDRAQEMIDLGYKKAQLSLPSKGEANF